MEEQGDKSLYIEEQRDWLIRWREQTGTGWDKIAKKTGLPKGTISVFASASGYNGKKQSSEYPIAQKIERMRHSMAQQAAISDEVPDVPEFFRTETSDALERMLGFAQHGMLVAAALEAGCGKSTAAQHYQNVFPNVFYVELSKSAGGMNNMIQMLLETMGIKDAPSGTYKMSKIVREQLGNSDKPLLIFDEAQHLAEDSLEEIRSWNDRLQVGVAFFGNVGILQKLARFPQLWSRLELKIQRRLPTIGDIDALADAWHVADPAIRKELHAICGRLGGLRNGTKVLRLARMMATAEGTAMGLDHLMDAWSELDVRMVAA